MQANSHAQRDHKREVMRSLSQQNICIILAILLVGVTLVSAMACQVHAVPSGHSHAAPTGPHDDATVRGSACLVAVLPVTLISIVFVVLWFAAPLITYTDHTTPFPLFHPPRLTAR